MPDDDDASERKPRIHGYERKDYEPEDPSERATLTVADALNALGERAERAEKERDAWRERFMVLRSRLHGIRDSLTKLDRELGRIIDEK